MKRACVIAMSVIALTAFYFWIAVTRVAATEEYISKAESVQLRQQDVAVKSVASMPLAFTENKGQWDERVKFQTSSRGATIWFTDDGVYYQFTRRITMGNPVEDYLGRESHDELTHEPHSVELLVIKASFVDANPDMEIVGEGLMEYKCNYFIGSDCSKWRTDVRNYESISLNNLYEGVDLRFFGSTKGRLQYEYSISNVGKLEGIECDYQCLTGTQLIERGKFNDQCEWADNTGVVAPPSAGVLTNLTVPGLHPSNENLMDHQEGIYKQPDSLAVELAFSTYLGGESEDRGRSIAVDYSGNAYVTGLTRSNDFPTESPCQGYQAGTDVFVTKVASSGEALIYSTFLGGSADEQGLGIDVDTGGSVCVTGYTLSPDYPTENAIQLDQGGEDAFVTRLSVQGNSLTFSTYLGGNDSDRGCGVAVDAVGNAYVTGYTSSSNFPIQNPYQSNQGGSDVFVSKLSSTGNSLVFSTYLGGDNVDEGVDIFVNGAGHAYVTGMTNSTNFPVHNQFQLAQGGGDAFTAKLDIAGDALVYSTYVGGSSWDRGEGIAVDKHDCVYMTGFTESSDFPTQGPFQNDQGLGDAFVVKLNPSGNVMIYGTFLGGNGYDWGRSIAVDSNDCAYVTGYTGSVHFPLQLPCQECQQMVNVFVTKLTSDGDSLHYSTCLGGDNWDDGCSVALNGDGCALITGWTQSSDFPTKDPYQTYQGSYDAFVTKICEYTQLCGDADSTGAVDIDDAVYLINYIFASGPPPEPYESGDTDCSGAVDIDDVVYLITYIFSGGNPPCDFNGDGQPDC